jgi:hypothetical protein
MINYIREFHKNKEINSATGRRNPTIVNMSWGITKDVKFTQVEQVTYKGRVFNKSSTVPGWTLNDFYSFGMALVGGWADNNGVLYEGHFENPVRDNSYDQDLLDAIADGIIFVASAGNSYSYMDVLGSDMYDNSYQYHPIINKIVQNTIDTSYFHRGQSPGSAPGVICVGNVDSKVREGKYTSSNAGPRVDIYAPGTAIMSAKASSSPQIADPRNSNYYKGFYGGTSMAAPQVTGIIACALETYPNMTAAQALSYIQNYANHGVLTDIPLNTTYTPGANPLGATTEGLWNGPNKYITYRPNTRPNQVYPVNDAYQTRPAAGLVYPRTGPNKSRPTTIAAPTTTTTSPP